MVSIAKAIIFLMTPFNFIFLLLHQEFITSEVGLLISLGLGVLNILILLKIYFQRDTIVDSPFFSIDRVRSIRYAFIYFLAICVSIFAILLSSLFLIAAAAVLVAAIVITVINLFIGVIGLILIILQGSFPAFISYDYAFDLFDTIAGFDVFSGVLITNILFGLFLLIAISISCFFLGKYIEDIDTGIAVIALFHNLLIMLFLYFAFVGGFSFDQFIQDFPFVYLLVITQFVSFYITNTVFVQKEQLEDYELPDVGKKTGRLIRLFIFLLTASLTGIIVLGLVAFLLVSIEFPLNFQNLPLVTFISMVIVGLMTELLLILSATWAIKGDFPIEIRIFEIEYREELLAKAQEFRDL